MIKSFIDILISSNHLSTCHLDISISFAAIAWQKKVFRKYFDKVEKFERFQCMAHRLLQAPTVEIPRDIVVWLSEVGEARASTWFYDTWTGERGNYTNAIAGYVGNNLSVGIESNWRYMRRNALDAVGYAAATHRISLEVFTPSLIQYLSSFNPKKKTRR